MGTNVLRLLVVSAKVNCPHNCLNPAVAGMLRLDLAPCLKVCTLPEWLDGCLDGKLWMVTFAGAAISSLTADVANKTDARL